MANGHHYENVRALETHLKAIPWKIEIEFCMIMGPHMYSKDIHDRALNQVVFDYHPICVGPSKQ
jgi:hypothetical protein